MPSKGSYDGLCRSDVARLEWIAIRLSQPRLCRKGTILTLPRCPHGRHPTADDPLHCSFRPPSYGGSIPRKSRRGALYSSRLPPLRFVLWHARRNSEDRTAVLYCDRTTFCAACRSFCRHGARPPGGSGDQGPGLQRQRSTDVCSAALQRQVHQVLACDCRFAARHARPFCGSFMRSLPTGQPLCRLEQHGPFGRSRTKCISERIVPYHARATCSIGSSWRGSGKG